MRVVDRSLQLTRLKSTVDTPGHSGLTDTSAPISLQSRQSLPEVEPGFPDVSGGGGRGERFSRDTDAGTPGHRQGFLAPTSGGDGWEVRSNRRSSEGTVFPSNVHFLSGRDDPADDRRCGEEGFVFHNTDNSSRTNPSTPDTNVIAVGSGPSPRL